MLNVSTGTTTGSISTLQSFRRAKYRAGQGIVTRFTSLFTPGEVGTTQIVGFGDEFDGLFIGFNGIQFGVMKRTKTSGSVVTEWTYPVDFIDSLDGTGSLPVIDFTKGNVFEITLQYLGFGMITFSVEDPSTGSFTRFHQIEYSNANVVPSMSSATLPCYILTDNGNTTSDVLVRVGSMALLSEGNVQETGVDNAFAYELSANSTEKQVFSIRAKTIFGSHENHVQTFLRYLTASMSSSGNRNCAVKILRNPTLTSPVWGDVSLTSSQLELDTVGVVTPGTGDVLFAVSLASNASISSELSNLDLAMSGGDVITVSASMSSSTGDVSVSLSVLEDM
jgi:hypothetical protein